MKGPERIEQLVINFEIETDESIYDLELKIDCFKTYYIAYIESKKYSNELSTTFFSIKNKDKKLFEETIKQLICKELLEELTIKGDILNEEEKIKSKKYLNNLYEEIMPKILKHYFEEEVIN